MEYLNLIFRLLAISQAVLFLLFIAGSSNPWRVKSVGMGLIVGITTYVGMPLIEDYTPYLQEVQLVWLFANIVPSLLLLFVFFIFEESCEIPPWIIGLVSVAILSSVWFHLSEGGYINSPVWLRVLKAVIVLIAVGLIWKGRENDLVELRTKLRTIFILVLAIQTLVVISVEMVTNFNPPLTFDTIVQFCIFVFGITANYFFAKLNPTGALMMPVAPQPVAAENVVDPHIAELLERMRSERLYADHDLRVSSLAQLINLPEYKLRKKINQELGYRNFNHFVNHYRIEEAGVKLREDTRTPVLTIALDVGFRSISSFNSAFQAHFGLSPTKYRAEILPDN